MGPQTVYSLAVFNNNLHAETGPDLLGFTPIEVGKPAVPKSELHSIKIFHSADLGASWTEIMHIDKPDAKVGCIRYNGFSCRWNDLSFGNHTLSFNRWRTDMDRVEHWHGYADDQQPSSCSDERDNILQSGVHPAFIAQLIVVNRGIYLWMES